MIHHISQLNLSAEESNKFLCQWLAIFPLIRIKIHWESQMWSWPQAQFCWSPIRWSLCLYLMVINCAGQNVLILSSTVGIAILVNGDWMDWQRMSCDDMSSSVLHPDELKTFYCIFKMWYFKRFKIGWLRDKIGYQYSLITNFRYISMGMPFFFSKHN